MEMILNFLSMGDYGVYVWGSVLITLGILGGNIWYASYRLRCVLDDLRGE